MTGQRRQSRSLLDGLLGYFPGRKIAFDDDVGAGSSVGVQPVVEGARGLGQELMIGLGAAAANDKIPVG